MHRRWRAAWFVLLSLLSASCSSPSMTSPAEHAVIIHFSYGSTDLQPLFALEEQLEQAIAAAGAGELDGNEVAADGSDARLFLYGPDADRLFEVVRPVLESSPLMRGARVVKRYGPPEPGVRKATVVVAS